MIDQITNNENLFWAWQKTKKAFSIGDIWFCDYELSKFEANLYNEIESIKNDIIKGSYRLQKLKIVPFPKGFDEEKNERRTRQAFYVSVRDQVTWLAVCNIIGSFIDEKMPVWSYGNRIYRPAWYEVVDDKSNLIIGNYRNYNGNIFRKWKQSWPLFRKQINATVAKMANPQLAKEDANEDVSKTIEDNEKNLEQQLPYILDNYFQHAEVDHLFWATLDFKKFYPFLKCSKIKDFLIKELKLTLKDEKLVMLIVSLFHFEIEYDGWSEAELKDLDLDKSKKFDGLPTGLLIAGFLANVALMDIDKEINIELNKNKKIAHFRFVDDHVILSTEFDSLIEWIDLYNKIVNKHEVGIVISNEKTEPSELREYLQLKTKPNLNKAIKKCKLDPLYPSPLMTETLAKVSGIAKMDLNLMSNNELEQLISDLMHLMITDFPDNEVKKETRISFAATMLAKASGKIHFNYTDIYNERKKLYKMSLRLIPDQYGKDLPKLLNSIIFDDSITSTKIEIYKTQIRKLISKPNDQTDDIFDSLELLKNAIFKIETEKFKLNKKTYKLLYKAVKENHQKVRLWIRLMQFCYHQNFNRFLEIWNLIAELEDNEKCHKLSATFLYNMYISLIIEASWQSIKAINSIDTSYSLKIQNEQFLYFIMSENFIKIIFDKESKSEHEFHLSIFIQLRVLLGSLLLILNKERPSYFDKYNILDLNKPHEGWFSSISKNNEINVWLFWILSKSHNQFQKLPNKYWGNLLSKLDVGVLNYQLPLILAFPHSDCLKKIEATNPEYVNLLPTLLSDAKYQGWLYDFAQSIDNNKNPLFFENLSKSHNNIGKNISTLNPNQITLYDYIRECSSSNIDYDLNLFEWTSLSILNKIITTIITEKETDLIGAKKKSIINLHPANIVLDKSILNSSNSNWSEFKDKIDKLVIKFRPFEEQIEDERYSINILLETYSRNDIPIIHGLGVLLFQLLCKEVNFPWVWNICDRNQILSFTIIGKISKSSISSFSQQILMSCLSPKNRETVTLKQNGVRIVDDEYAPFLIFNLKELKKVIEQSIIHLENNQISVERDLRRQLIPISLISFTKSNNPFKEVDHD